MNKQDLLILLVALYKTELGESILKEVGAISNVEL